MEKIIFADKVSNYLNQLVYVLFEEEYFSYSENAQVYVNKIVDFIVSEIASFPHKKTPLALSHLGTYYIFYKSNKRTTWYIFFEKKATAILITGISNNHCEEAKEL